MKILICEDNEISRKILARFLEPYGEVVMAEDGEIGVEYYFKAIESGEPFDLVLLDVVMPNKNGIGVLTDIRAHEAQTTHLKENPVPVVMLTGQADFDAINWAKSLGASEYFLKPIEEEKLLRGLQRLELIDDPTPGF